MIIYILNLILKSHCYRKPFKLQPAKISNISKKNTARKSPTRTRSLISLFSTLLGSTQFNDSAP